MECTGIAEPAEGPGHPAHESLSLGLLRSRPDPVQTRSIAGDRTHRRARQRGGSPCPVSNASGAALRGSAPPDAARGARAGGWRRGGDLNPRCRCRHTRFPSVLLKPLGHLSRVLLRGTRRAHSCPVGWRRGGDLNPRCSCLHAGFRNQSIQPLWHLSVERLGWLPGRARCAGQFLLRLLRKNV